MNTSSRVNMSSNDNKKGKGNSNYNSNKKYCGVCHKAGKPAAEYESHYTKSLPGPKGIVTCPMILASVCKRCGQSGHFSDHCKIKIQSFRDISGDASCRDAYRKESTPVPLVKRTQNGFDALANSSDDEDIVMPSVKRPKITVESEIKKLAPNGVSFASALSKPAPTGMVEQSGFQIPEKFLTLWTNQKSDKEKLAEKIIQERKSWAFDYDSDLESDDDEEKGYKTAW